MKNNPVDKILDKVLDNKHVGTVVKAQAVYEVAKLGLGAVGKAAEFAQKAELAQIQRDPYWQCFPKDGTPKEQLEYAYKMGGEIGEDHGTCNIM